MAADNLRNIQILSYLSLKTMGSEGGCVAQRLLCVHLMSKNILCPVLLQSWSRVPAVYLEPGWRVELEAQQNLSIKSKSSYKGALLALWIGW